MDTQESSLERRELNEAPAETEAAGEQPAQPGAASAAEDRNDQAASEDPQGRRETMQGVAVSSLTRGQIVDGLIVHIDENGALVDVGTKSEGHVSMAELGGGTDDEGRSLQVGDRVAVYVVHPEDEDGNPVLSKKRADYERIWQRLIHAYEQGEVLTAMVTDRVKGGLVVDLGLRGFLPASHVRTRNVYALDRFVGQSLKVKIVEVDPARKRVVVSQKEAAEEERLRRRERVLASLQENKIYRGVVRRITDYGAFVDLGGVDGLLHITEMSWTRINHPSEVLKAGDRIEVMVLRFDRERGRVSLGLKQILPDPWEDARARFSVGQIVMGTVSRVVPSGAFVRLESGIEGIVPNAEIPGERGQRARDVLSPGGSIQVKIINMRPSERRMTLSLRQVQQAHERQEMKEYLDRQQEESRVTIGDLFGSVLSGARAARTETESDSEPMPAEVAEGEAVEHLEAQETQEQTDSSEEEACSSSESPAESEPAKD